MSKNTQLQETTPQSLTADLNAMRGEFAGAVNVRREILTIPVMKVTNALSDAFKAKIADLGDFYCKATGENFKNTLTIIPMFISESASLLDKKTSRPLCKTNDLKKNLKGQPCHKCPFNAYWNDWSKGAPECKTAIDVIGLIYRGAEHEYTKKDIIQIDFRKMAYKAGTTLVNLCGYDQTGVPFGSKYTLVTKHDKKDNYDFHVVDANAIKQEKLSNEELAKVIPIARQLNEARKAGNMEVVDEGEGKSFDDDIPL